MVTRLARASELELKSSRMNQKKAVQLDEPHRYRAYQAEYVLFEHE